MIKYTTYCYFSACGQRTAHNNGCRHFPYRCKEKPNCIIMGYVCKKVKTSNNCYVVTINILVIKDVENKCYECICKFIEIICSRYTFHNYSRVIWVTVLNLCYHQCLFALRYLMRTSNIISLYDYQFYLQQHFHFLHLSNLFFILILKINTVLSYSTFLAHNTY